MWKHWANCWTFWPIFTTPVLLLIYFVYSSVSIYWTFTIFIGQCPVWLAVSTPLSIVMNTHLDVGYCSLLICSAGRHECPWQGNVIYVHYATWCQDMTLYVYHYISTGLPNYYAFHILSAESLCSPLVVNDYSGTPLLRTALGQI